MVVDDSARHLIAVDGSDGVAGSSAEVVSFRNRCGCPALLKSFPDLCEGAIAGVSLIRLDLWEPYSR